MLVRKSTLRYSISKKGLICANGRPIGLGGFARNTLLGKSVDQHSKNIPTHSWSYHFLRSKQRYYIPSFKVKYLRSYRSGHDRDINIELLFGHDVNFNSSCGIEEVWSGNNFKTHIALSKLCPRNGVRLLYNKNWYDLTTGGLFDNKTSICPAGIYFGYYTIYSKSTSLLNGKVSYYKKTVKGFLIQRKPLKDKLQGVVVFLDDKTGRKHTSRYYTQAVTYKKRKDRIGFLSVSKKSSSAFIYIPFSTYMKFPYLLGYVPTNNVSEQDYLFFTKRLGDLPACSKGKTLFGLDLNTDNCSYPLNSIYMFGEKVNFSFFEPIKVDNYYIRVAGIYAEDFLVNSGLAANMSVETKFTVKDKTSKSEVDFKEFLNRNYEPVDGIKTDSIKTASDAYESYLLLILILLVVALLSDNVSFEDIKNLTISIKDFIKLKHPNYLEIPANDLTSVKNNEGELVYFKVETEVPSLQSDKLLTNIEYVGSVVKDYKYNINPVITKILGLMSNPITMEDLNASGILKASFEGKPLVCNVGSPYYSL